MAEEVFTRTGKPTIRQGHLTWLLFEVLRDPGAPPKAAEAVAQVERRLDPTPREVSTNPSGIRRWETFVRWTSSWAKSLGWVEKNRARWSLTPAGLQAMTDHPGDELDRAIHVRYQALRESARIRQSGERSTTLLRDGLDSL